jgi:hypothetical protein
MAKTTEQVAAETKWLDEAKAYAKSMGWERFLDFSKMGQFQSYYDRGQTAEEAVDDQMTDEDQIHDIDFDSEDEL